MSKQTNLLKAGLAVLAFGVMATAGDAGAATTFRLGSPGVSLSLGTGWSDSSSFDADFDTISNNNRQWSLNVGQTESFKIGEIQNEEGTIDSNETNNLTVTYTFNMTLPGDIDVVLTTTGVATTGDVDDGADDLVISFNALLVNFGNGGQYQVDIRTMNFDDEDETKDVIAEFKLLSDSSSSASNGVPEPMTLGLLGMGLLGLGAAARRRRS